MRRMAGISIVVAVSILITNNIMAADQEETPQSLEFKVKTLAGEEIGLDKYHGDVVLIVNVASECGLTPQYKQLQALHEKYAKDGLRILGFPCNQFGEQEPGSSEDIRKFCTANYGVTFDLFEKVDVNGENTSPLYRHLKKLNTKPKGSGEIGWNFEKFLLDRNGKVIARFDPRTKPDDPEVVGKIKASLAEKN